MYQTLGYQLSVLEWAGGGGYTCMLHIPGIQIPLVNLGIVLKCKIGLLNSTWVRYSGPSMHLHVPYCRWLSWVQLLQTARHSVSSAQVTDASNRLRNFDIKQVNDVYGVIGGIVWYLLSAIAYEKIIVNAARLIAVDVAFIVMGQLILLYLLALRTEI